MTGQKPFGNRASKKNVTKLTDNIIESTKALKRNPGDISEIEKSAGSKFNEKIVRAKKIKDEKIRFSIYISLKFLNEFDAFVMDEKLKRLKRDKKDFTRNTLIIEAMKKLMENKGE